MSEGRGVPGVGRMWPGVGVGEAQKRATPRAPPGASTDGLQTRPGAGQKAVHAISRGTEASLRHTLIGEADTRQDAQESGGPAVVESDRPQAAADQAGGIAFFDDIDKAKAWLRSLP